jgi:integrase/recombinase XerC
MKDRLSASVEDYAVWLRHEGRKRSPKTIEVYCRSVRALQRHARTRGLDTWDQLTRQQVRAFLGGMRDAGKSEAYIAQTFFALKSFFTYLVAEEWRDGRPHPMDGMEAPKPVIQRPEGLSAGQIQAILAQCKKPRDLALIWVAADTGARLAELASMRWDKLEFGQRPRVWVVRKGREQWLGLGGKTVLAIRRWQRACGQDAGPMWGIGRAGIYRVIRDRGAAAGLAVHPHMLRHATFAELKRAGREFDQLVEMGGWSGPAMALRYGAWEVADRAQDTARKLSLGDRL